MCFSEVLQFKLVKFPVTPPQNKIKSLVTYLILINHLQKIFGQVKFCDMITHSSIIIFGNYIKIFSTWLSYRFF